MTTLKICKKHATIYIYIYIYIYLLTEPDICTCCSVGAQR